MHFQCTKQDLVSGINLVEKGLSNQNTLQILSGFNLQVEKNRLVLSSTNLEISVKTSVPCTTFKQGTVILDGRLLSSMVRKLPDQEIIFEKHDSQVIVTAGTIEFKLNILTDESFPEFPHPKKTLLSMPTSLLEKAIRNTNFATANDETRPVLSGVLFEIENDDLNFVATDSNRLVFFQLQPNLSTDNRMRVILPSKTINELVKCLDVEDEEVKISMSESQMVFEFGTTLFATRTIEGQFPNYRVVFPTEQPIKIVAKKSSLLSAIERASLFDRKGKQPVIFHVTDGILEIKTISNELGELSEQLNVEHSGENGKAAYSGKYLLDMLKVVDSDQICFEFNSDLRQAVMRPFEKVNHKYIIMPVRID